MKVKVELGIEVPDGISMYDIEEFLRFEFHYSGSCSRDNPMFEEDYDVVEFDIDY
jgi:hypothetical protein